MTSPTFSPAAFPAAQLRWAVLVGTTALGLLGCSGPTYQDVGTDQARVEGGELDEEATQVFRVLGRVTGFNELCSATLISPQLMLTARHCVAPTPEGNVDCPKDRFGETVAPTELKFSNDTAPTLLSRWFGAAAVLVSSESDFTCGYDIAVVVLDEPVPARVARPAEPRFSPLIRNGETYSAVGYGASNADERFAEYGIRHSRTNLSVACGQNDNCGDRMVKEQEFIGDEGACKGDSGGPALDSDGRVIGVLSRGAEGCESPIYTGVPSFAGLLVEAAVLANTTLGAPLPVWAGGAPPEPSSTVEDSTVSAPELDTSNSSMGTSETADADTEEDRDSSGARQATGLAREGCSAGRTNSPWSLSWSLGALLGMALVTRRTRRR